MLKNNCLLGVMALLWLQVAWAQDSTTCHLCSPLHPRFESFETSVINGSLTVNLHFKTSSALILQGQPEVEMNDYFLVDYPQQPESRQLAKNETFTLPLHLDYDLNNLPYYPVEVRVYETFVHKGIENRASRSVFVYFTPYNTIEVWDDIAFQTQKRKWLHGNEATAPPRIDVSPDSIPVSDIPAGYEAAEGEVFQYRFVKGLAYAIPMLYSDFQGYTIDSVQRVGCFWGFEDKFQGEINNLRIFTPHQPDGFAPIANLGLKNVRVEIWQDRQVSDDHIATFFTDNDGFVVNGSGNRIVHFEKCASNNSLDIYLKIKLEDVDDKIRVKFQGEWAQSHEFITPIQVLNFQSIGTFVQLNFANNANGLEMPTSDLGNVFTWAKWEKDLINQAISSTGASIHHQIKLKVSDDSDDTDCHYQPLNDVIKLSQDCFVSEFVVMHEFGHFVDSEINAGAWNYGCERTH